MFSSIFEHVISNKQLFKDYNLNGCYIRSINATENFDIGIYFSEDIGWQRLQKKRMLA